MHYSIILSLFFFQLSAASKSSFYPIPVSPRLGEKVFLFCELEIDESQFSSIVPDLIVDIVGTHQFHFSAISSELGDLFYGYEIPDLNRIRMQGFIFISSLNESDLSINFTCLQTLFQNDKAISASLILNNFHTPQNSINPTQSLTSHIMPSTTSLNPSSEDVGKSPEATATPGISDTPIQTTSTLANPTPTTKQVHGFYIPQFEIVMGGVSASVFLSHIFLLGIGICIGYFICYFCKKKSESSEIATEQNPVQLQPISNTSSGSKSSVSTTSYESCDDPSFISFSSIPTQANPSSEESHHAVRRYNSVETQKSGPEETI